MTVTIIQHKENMGIKIDRSLLPNLPDLLSPDIDDLIFTELAKELIKSTELTRSSKLMEESFKLHLSDHLTNDRYKMLQRLYEQQELMLQLKNLSKIDRL